MARRLAPETLADLPRGVRRPAYDRSAPPAVLHLGPGAFHRAHQAAFFDDLLALDPRWTIAAASLRSAAIVDALRSQGGLYTLTLLGEQRETRVIGAIAAFHGPDDRPGMLRRFASPNLRLVTATVTEKAYAAPDAGRPHRPRSFVGCLVEGLAARRDAGGGGLTMLSCDNLPANGATLRSLVVEAASKIEIGLADWIAGEVRFPGTMVDSITPHADDALHAYVEDATGLVDAAPVQREPFAQWIIEDDFAGERPPLDAVGAVFVRDVSRFEAAKLRLLNAAHSALAYLGLLRGHATVAEAMRDGRLARFVETLMRETIAPTIEPPAELALSDYIGHTLARFRNPGVAHRLAQIAQDGSQKIPIRMLGSARIARGRGGDVDRLALVVAAWFGWLARADGNAASIADPLAGRLVGPAAHGDVDALLGMREVFPAELADDAPWRTAVLSQFEAIATPADLDDALARLGPR